MSISLIPLLKSGWQLAAKGYFDYSPSDRRKQQWKISFHLLFNVGFASRWFEFLQSTDFSYVSFNRPRLYIKPFRTYISIKWSKAQKVKVILDTYRFIKSKESVLGQILSCKDGKVIACLNFDNSYTGYLKLWYDDRFRKEGELVLTLECSELGGKISSVAFSLEETEGCWRCIIGCVQAHNCIDNQNAFNLTQKLLHGLRPNSFVVHAIQELSRYLGCSSIYCVGNSIQAHRGKHFVHIPWRHSIYFNYNAFWCEVGGKDIGKDWFELPLVPVRRDIQEIKSHKRSMYRKRYAILDDLSLKICDATKS